MSTLRTKLNKKDLLRISRALWDQWNFSARKDPETKFILRLALKVDALIEGQKRKRPRSKPRA